MYEKQVCYEKSLPQSGKAQKIQYLRFLSLCLFFGKVFFIGAIFIHANKDIFALFDGKTITAGRAGLVCGHIPRGKIAFGIFGTAKEHCAVLAEALDHRRTAFRAGNADLLTNGLGKFAFREIAARIEFTVTALSDDDIAAAKLTFEVGLFGFFLFLFGFSRCVERFCIFTFGITGTSQEFTESA